MWRLDVKEILKQQVKSPTDNYRPNPTKLYGISDQYIILDSVEKNAASHPEYGELSFNFMIQGVTRNQNIGVRDQLDTIIEMQIMPFFIPLLQDVEYSLNVNNLTLTANPSAPTNGALTQLPFGGRVTLVFSEIGLQSISDASEKRHHFEFDSALAPTKDRLILTPINDKYIFTDPIKDIHGLTACFYNPYERISFPPDILYNVIPTSKSNPPQLDFEVKYHNLLPGDRIFITGLSTSDSAINSYINRRDGHIVGNGTTSTIVRLNPDVDTTSLGFPFTSGPVIIIIPKNRIRIPLRLRRIIDRLTNYIAP
jgi:hypothetical protein